VTTSDLDRDLPTGPDPAAGGRRRPPPLDDPRFRAAERALAVAERRLDDARRARAAAKDDLAVALHQAAGPYRDGGCDLSLESAAHLYWERLDLRVNDIAAAFGLRVAAVRSLAGPQYVVAECDECSSTFVLVRRSRSEATGRSGAWCDGCRTRLLTPGWSEDGSAAPTHGAAWDDDRWDEPWPDERSEGPTWTEPPPGTASWPWP
jgi:hypothetical protein